MWQQRREEEDRNGRWVVFHNIGKILYIHSLLLHAASSLLA
jgi:hypothetical protein